MLTKIVQDQTYQYFTREEAREQGLEYQADWRTASAGDWTLLDDGYIAPVLSAKETAIQEHGRYVKTIRFPHGTYFGRRSQEATSEDRACLYSATGKRTDFSDPDRPLSAKERCFVMLYLKDFDVIRAFLRATDCSPTSKTFRKRAAAYFKRANIQAAIEEQLKARLHGIGLDEEWWGKELKLAIEGSDSDRDRLRGLELAARVLGLLSSNPRVEQLTGSPISPDELKQIKSELHPSSQPRGYR